VGYLKKNNIMSEHEKWVTCYHEIGHALAAALQTHSAPVQKITVLPRTSGVLGFAQQLETSEPVMHTRTQLENRIVTICAGRAAEEVHFHEVTTGASNDIEKATAIARAIIARYGMSDEFDMVCLERSSGGYLGQGSSRQCSETTAHAVDAKVIELVRRQHQKAIDLLRANEAKLDELAHFLYEKETITGEQFMAILNR
jgi:cell division protease FtsH